MENHPRLADKDLKCVDCGETFVFTGGEQEFFMTKNFSEPKRCKPCRDKKKEAKEAKERRNGNDR